MIIFFRSRLLVDIAFLKLRLLQGLFSRPDCWSSWRNNDNSCISQVGHTHLLVIYLPTPPSSATQQSQWSDARHNSLAFVTRMFWG